jgi:hypothetical protein
MRKESGRYDLINSDGSDNGADFHINAGQRHLDRLADIPAAIGRFFKDVSAGDVLITFKNSRSVKEVWCVGPDTDGITQRLPLTKVDMRELRGVDANTLVANYTGLFGDMDRDRPTYYAPAQLRLKTDDGIVGGGIGGLMDVLATGHQYYNGILFLPPADQTYSIEVVGAFYQDALSTDTDSTYWTEQHPEILYWATMRSLEVNARNREGVSDWDSAIEPAMQGIDMDGIAEEVSDTTEMEG